MNKTAIKNFAIWARVQLIEAAKLRAYEYEITENGENKPFLKLDKNNKLTTIRSAYVYPKKIHHEKHHRCRDISHG